MKRNLWPWLALAILFGLSVTACARNRTTGSAPAVASKEAGGERGGGTEGVRGPTLTNPGGLPAAPETGNANLSQLGEERMVKVDDPKGRFSVLFVDDWTQEPGSTPDSLRSRQSDWYAEVEVVSEQNQTPLKAAQAVDTSLARATAGYQRLALTQGDVHGLPGASVIYQYDSGTSPVTGKPQRFVASQVFVGGGPANSLGHVTVSAPYAFYGDISEIFDKILAGFAWK